MQTKLKNADEATVDGFGREWSAFRQTDDDLPDDERRAIFDGYFAIFPWDALPREAVGADIGCGSGRWAAVVAPRVGTLHLIDASPAALDVARTNLAAQDNAAFHHASAAALPFADGTLDFAYSLGVLHHMPDVAGAITHIVTKLKPGAPFLVYLYYALDNRPAWFRLLWQVSDTGRLGLSRMPHGVRMVASQIIAATIYWPLARIAAALDKFGALPASWPLAFYRRHSFYVMRTDAFDRFCTALEQRFTREQVRAMMQEAGLEAVRFSQHEPYWVAVGTKATP